MNGTNQDFNRLFFLQVKNAMHKNMAFRRTRRLLFAFDLETIAQRVWIGGMCGASIGMTLGVGCIFAEQDPFFCKMLDDTGHFKKNNPTNEVDVFFTSVKGGCLGASVMFLYPIPPIAIGLTLIASNWPQKNKINT